MTAGWIVASALYVLGAYVNMVLVQYEELPRTVKRLLVIAWPLPTLMGLSLESYERLRDWRDSRRAAAGSRPGDEQP